jgi:polysaccharide biosynthesis transport protein
MSLQQNTELPWLASEGMAHERAPLDVWGFVRRRKSIVFVLAVVGAGLGYFLFQQQVPLYRSSARMEVIHSSNEGMFDNLMGDDMLEDAMFIIPSPDVLRPAFQKKRLADCDTFRGMHEDDAIDFITLTLGIEQLSPGVIELQFDGGDPRDTPKITNAIANEYIARQMASFEGESEKLKKLLATDRKNIERQLLAAEQEYDEFVRNVTLLSSGSDTNQARARLSALNGQIADLDIQEAALVSQLELMEQKLREGGQRDALMLLIGKETDKRTDERYVSQRKMSETLLPWVIEATVLKQKVGAGHPRLKEVEKRIELIREEYGMMEGLITEPLPEEQNSDYLAVYRLSLSHELEQLQTQRADLQEMATAAEQEAHLVQNDEQTERRLNRKIDRFQKQYDGIARQIEQTEVNAGMSGVRAELIAPAVYGSLVYPILYQFVGLGGFLGMIAGLGLGYLVELADCSFRKPDEIVREFGVPILGHVPYMKKERLKLDRAGDTGGMDRTLVSAYLPRSRPAEAYRSVRTAICFSALGEPHRVVQVTSPAAGDGKSTLAANLAVSLAQSGKRTILVESDFRRPSVHKITGVRNEVGIVDVLRGTAELADVIQEVSVEELCVLPCGRLPRNPSELLTRPEYESLLEVLRDKFDYVVVDSPPVLVVTDACSVAARTDAVIVCMRLGRHARDFGRRTLDRLRDVGANIVGVVLNGVEESDAYGYGSYNYSDYGRSYKNFAYAYSYAEENENCFAEEDETVSVKRLISAGDNTVSGEELIDMEETAQPR